MNLNLPRLPVESPHVLMSKQSPPSQLLLRLKACHLRRQRCLRENCWWELGLLPWLPWTMDAQGAPVLVLGQQA